MEVHHHPHVEKKGFREYFLEFLMIFIAVTLGFFAENVRENISDKEQIHQYIRSMINDLRADVNMCTATDSTDLSYCKMIDTISGGLVNTSKNMGKTYYLARRLTMMASFAPAVIAKTYTQMTSTGAFRLVRHQWVADSIASYYQLIKSFENWSELQRQRVNDLIATNDRVFDARVFTSIYKAMEQNLEPDQIIRQNNAPLLSYDPRDINIVLMRHQYFYGFLKLMNRRAGLAAARATHLINLLKKEYSIENE